MRFLLILASALVLACWSGYDAALAWSRSVAAGRTLPFLASDPQNQLQAHEAYFASPQTLADHAATIQRIALAALEQTPLEPTALRQLAVISAFKGKASAPLLELAARTSRRDLANELLLIEQAVTKGTISEALMHYDHALSVHPEAGERLYPILASAITEKDIRDALIPHANRPWFAPFIRASLTENVNLQAVTDLILAAQGKLTPESFAGLASILLGYTEKRGAYAETRRLATALPGLPHATLDEPGFSSATTDPRLGPYAWRISQSAGVNASLLNKTLVIAVEPDHTEVAAERVTLLRPGSYQILQQISYAPDRPKPLLTWQVDCRGTSSTSALTNMTMRPDGKQVASWTLDVPSACQAQRWQLVATAGEGSRVSLATISNFVVKPR